MSSQFGSYTSKQYFSEKYIDNTIKKTKARQSQPPMASLQADNYQDSSNDFIPRRPRPSDMGIQSSSKQLITRSNSNQFVQYDPTKRNANLTKNQGLKDFLLQRKQELTLQYPLSKQINEMPLGTTSQKNLASKYLSPEFKYSKPTERKYSHKIENLTSFKSEKPSVLTPASKALITQNLQTSKPVIPPTNSGAKITSPVSNGKRSPRFSQSNNQFFMDNQEQSTTVYNQKSYQTDPKPKEPSKPLQKKIIPFSPSTFNPQNIKEPSEINSGTSAWKKQKQLKQTVSTQSTFTYNKTDSPSTRGRPERYEFKVTDFVKGKQLGSGKFGEVCIVKHKLTGFVCAMKSIPKAMIREQNIIGQLTRQLKIQTYLDHPNIIKLYGFFHDKDYIYLLLELGSSGQLYKVLKQKTRLPQSSAAYVIKQVCEAVRYLHFFKIIHRDLKPQNIVIQSGTVKLCDFGWAVCRGGELRSTFCGTPLYVSPEILKGQLYDEKIDLWSIGILTYELLVGNIPFQINTEEELIKIIKEDIIFPTNIKVSPQAKDFVLRILKKNPEDRLKINELLEHEFLKKSPEMASELEEC